MSQKTQWPEDVADWPKTASVVQGGVVRDGCALVPADDTPPADTAKDDAPAADGGALEFEYPSLVDDGQRKKPEEWHAAGADPSKPFEREPRYLVIKVNDALAHLSSSEIYALGEMGEKITSGRSSAGKLHLVTVVVEQDWPEFELVWEMIKARVAGKGNDARRVVACLNACAGISTENLEDNLPVKELADRYNAVLKQRDMLLDVLRKTADDLAYVAYNLDGSKIDGLEAGLSESTCPSDTALIAERNCREAISRVEGGAA